MAISTPIYIELKYNDKEYIIKLLLFILTAIFHYREIYKMLKPTGGNFQIHP